MKIANYAKDGKESIGLVVENYLIDPLEVLSTTDTTQRAYFSDTVAFIKSGELCLKIAHEIIKNAHSSAKKELSKFKLLAPIMPSTILCSGSNYKDHNKEKANTPISGKEPEFFIKTSDCGSGIPYLTQIFRRPTSLSPSSLARCVIGLAQTNSYN